MTYADAIKKLRENDSYLMEFATLLNVSLERLIDEMVI